MPVPDDRAEPVDDGVEAERRDHLPDAPPADREAHAADVFLEDQDPADAERSPTTTGRWTGSVPR